MKNNKKSTGIAGLDALFYGGLHMHQGDNGLKGINILARGKHGVNKIHLAMQICEGLSRSDSNTELISHNEEINKRINVANNFRSLIKEKTDWNNQAIRIEDESVSLLCTNEANSKEEIEHTSPIPPPKILFVSLNKDTSLLKNSYYDFYIQRLIRNVRTENNWADLSRELLRTMLWYQEGNGEVAINDNITKILKECQLPSIYGIDEYKGEDRFGEYIKTGYIYYNGRTHALHIRHQKGAIDTGDMMLCKLCIPDDPHFRIIGKDKLNKGQNAADGLTTFQNMMQEIEQYGKSNSTEDAFVMIDGLSRLSKEEIVQCPFNALSDKLRNIATTSVITADEKLLPSDINVDIVIDMDIRESDRPDHLYSALKISKCLFQKNAYGWHRYKMRVAGIEVIPSIHYQMTSRFLMDDVVTDASLPINEFPYPYWLNENKTTFFDNKKQEEERRRNNNLSSTDNINDVLDAEEMYIIRSKRIVETEGEIHGIVLNNTKNLIDDILPLKELTDNDHLLYINFDNNRSSFYSKYIKNYIQNNSIKEIVYKKIHLFNFQPGYIPADEFLWSIDQQVQAIEKNARKVINYEDKKGQTTHYKHVHLIIGDLNYIHYAYPCLSMEELLLPAISVYTKKHHMTNYVYATIDNKRYTEDTNLFKKEIETIRQMSRISDIFDDKTKN